MAQERLTAADVAAKRFTPVKLREGYSMDEVDDFLDAVQQTLGSEERETGVSYAVHQTLEAAHERLGREASEERKKRMDAEAELLETRRLLSESQAAVEELREEIRVAQDEEPEYQLRFRDALAKKDEVIALLERRLLSTEDSESDAAILARMESGELQVPDGALSMLRLATEKRAGILAEAKAKSEAVLLEAHASADAYASESRVRVERELESITRLRDERLDALRSEQAELRLAIEELLEIESGHRLRLEQEFAESLAAVRRPRSVPIAGLPEIGEL